MGESSGFKYPDRIPQDVQYNTTSKVAQIAPNVFAKQQAKEQARKELMENLAPSTMAKQEAKAEIKQQIKEKRGKKTKDFNKGDIVRDIHSGHIYEVIEPYKRGMGKFRDVDTNDVNSNFTTLKTVSITSI